MWDKFTDRDKTSTKTKNRTKKQVRCCERRPRDRARDAEAHSLGFLVYSLGEQQTARDAETLQRNCIWSQSLRDTASQMVSVSARHCIRDIAETLQTLRPHAGSKRPCHKTVRDMRQ